MKATTKTGAPTMSSSAKSSRTPSPYNNYMKVHITEVKKQHPELSHKDAFKMAASNWKSSPMNPKNQ